MSLGIEDGRIQDSAITASTIHNSAHVAHLGRLNLVARSGKNGAWCAKTSNNKEWLQIDLGNPTTVTKVATQGRQDSNHWPTSYSIPYSLTGSYWVHYTARGKVKVITPCSLHRHHLKDLWSRKMEIMWNFNWMATETISQIAGDLSIAGFQCHAIQNRSK